MVCRVKSIALRLREWEQRPVVSVVLTFAGGFVLGYLFACFAEFVRTGSVYYTCTYLSAHWRQLALGALVLTALIDLIAVVSGRIWIADLVVGGVVCAASWVNLQKLIYRGDPLLPKDLVQASDAMGIAGELNLSIPRESWLFAAFILLSAWALRHLRLPFRKGAAGWCARGALLLAFLLFIPLYIGRVLCNRSSMERFNITVSVSSMSDTYYRSGFVTGFCMMTKTLLGEQAPKGYSEEAVMQALAQVELPRKGEERQCDVIVVLLESYFDLSNYDTAQISEPLYENYNRIAKEGISGQMLTEKYGGGTANIEFSVLTGYSNNFLNVGSMPYIEYVYDDFLCYPQFLHAQGYTTMALHSYDKNFYSRDEAYPAMGFDLFVGQEAFDEEDRVGNYVGDSATLEKALELYRSAGDAPVFLHVVTMQNHIPNQPGEYPDDYAVKAVIEGESDYYNGCLSSVATSLRDTDRAIGEFIDALREEDRDVVVLFFGDHQTNINGDQGEDLLEHIESFTSLPQEEQQKRSHVTPYLMWANFDIKEEGIDGGLLPSYLLLPTMLQEYGVLRPAWMDWLYQTEDLLEDRYFDLYFHVGEEEQLLDEEQLTVYRAQQMLQYDLMFGKGYAAPALYGREK